MTPRLEWYRSEGASVSHTYIDNRLVYLFTHEDAFGPGLGAWIALRYGDDGVEIVDSGEGATTAEMQSSAEQWCADARQSVAGLSAEIEVFVTWKPMDVVYDKH